MAIISSLATSTSTSSIPLATNTPNILFPVSYGLGKAFSWSSLGLAVLTAFLQGLVTAIAAMTEQSGRWTFRFRLAMFEHRWWTVVSTLLLCSLVMSTLSFLSGGEGGTISVLVLSATTFIAIVRYMIPALQQKHFTRCRWLAWTGDSRTSISKDKAGYCGNAENWKELVQSNKIGLNGLQPTPSDTYGWHIRPVRGIAWDATDVLNVAGTNAQVDAEGGTCHAGLYDNGEEDSKRASLKWGHEQNFRPRVSRAVTSMPEGLLKSNPATTDGYDGKGLTLAMGILGRNKGLDPGKLVFRMSRPVSTHMENNSTWAPRPAKVLRSFYIKTMSEQYHGLGEDYVASAVELALLMADMPHWAVCKWLSEGLEHQSLDLNRFLARNVVYDVPEERAFALAAHYESSYVSMIISLNNMDPRMKDKHERRAVICRPDLLSTGLLLKAWGHREPSWWNREDVRVRRANEIRQLATEVHNTHDTHDTHETHEAPWKMPIARLLGLKDWPKGFENNPSQWDNLHASVPPSRSSSPHATYTNHQQFDEQGDKPVQDGYFETGHPHWDGSHGSHTELDEIDRAHATDADRRLFDQRSSARRLGKSRLERTGDEMGHASGDYCSRASTPVASASHQSDQSPASHPLAQQPSPAHEQSGHVQAEDEQPVLHGIELMEIEASAQSNVAAGSQIPDPAASPLLHEGEGQTVGQAQHTRGRIIGENGYELDIYPGHGTFDH